MELKPEKNLSYGRNGNEKYYIICDNPDICLTAARIYEKLIEAYGEPRWWSDDPFTVMFQAVLVQNTSWTLVEKVTADIGSDLDPKILADKMPSEIEAMIRACGCSRRKAQTIIDLAIWLSGYGYDIENTRNRSTNELRDELLGINGIGAETADAILVYALCRPSFIVDAYTRRFLKRLGYMFDNDGQIRSFFEDDLSKDYRLYGHLHWLILDHGIQRCQKRPKCNGCVFDGCRERIRT
ncbi:MAG: endonuclease [Lachnospiraceae bacterium]|nr:endonuclease [Lachnospiraceae bacterium]